MASDVGCDPLGKCGFLWDPETDTYSCDYCDGKRRTEMKYGIGRGKVMEKTLDFNEYQDLADETAIYPDESQIIYPALGLASEAGEVAGKISKALRDDTDYDFDAIALELGDVLWFLAALASDLGMNLSDIAAMNIEKLKSRKERGKLQGSGDYR